MDFMGMHSNMLETLLECKNQVIHAKGADPGDAEAQTRIRQQAGAAVARDQIGRTVPHPRMNEPQHDHHVHAPDTVLGDVGTLSLGG